MNNKQVELVDQYLNSHGSVILSEAEAAGIDIALACAIVDKESNGRNIFGCDHGDIGDRPPFCQHEVTESRVALLRDGGKYSHGMNGVGLTQLTYYAFVERAESLGGAHLPWTQCRVGFELLKSYLDSYSYRDALAAYNAGEGNIQGGLAYADDVAVRHKAWEDMLSELEDDNITGKLVDGYQSQILVPNKDGYLYDESTKLWVAAPGHRDAEIKMEGPWPRLILPDTPPPPPEPSRWEWWDYDTYYAPYARGTGSYVDVHPTRYDDVWRADLEEAARFMVDNFGVWCNTYVGHPPPHLVGGVIYDSVSIDIWGPGGRGTTGYQDRVDEAFWWFFDNGQEPWIRWCIRNGRIWDPYNLWYDYWDYDVWSDGPHIYHAHITVF